MFVLKIVYVSFFIASALSADSTDKPVPEIVTETNNVDINGYNFEYKTSDGVSRQEEAHLITLGENQGIAVKGSYSYTAPDGEQYIVSFTADDKGYKPQIRVASSQ